MGNTRDNPPTSDEKMESDFLQREKMENQARERGVVWENMTWPTIDALLTFALSAADCIDDMKRGDGDAFHNASHVSAALRRAINSARDEIND